MERIDASAAGRVEVVGRWFGVRGRRFVRPALTLGRKDGEVRALADLDHKPWAAEDGEIWRAAFSLDSKLEEAREIELTVAPDIVVTLRSKSRKLASPGATLAAAQAARPSRGVGTRPSAEPASEAPGGSDASAEQRRRPTPSSELERLGARLAAANYALEQERERRVALAKTLEDERTASRMLRTELGQARSELEIAAAARAEAAEAETELEAARRELRDAAGRHEELVQAHAALQQELQEHAGALKSAREALESAREALAEERGETGRLRNRLAQAQEARQQRAGGPPAPARSAARLEHRPPEPIQTQRYDVEGITEDVETRRAPAAAPARRETRRDGQTSNDPQPWDPPTAERLRPVNPSLRHRTYWFGRLLALLVLLGVIAAVWLVLHSTVLH